MHVLKRVVGVVVCVAACLAWCGVAAHADEGPPPAAERTAELEAEVARLRARLAELETELARLRGEAGEAGRAAATAEAPAGEAVEPSAVAGGEDAATLRRENAELRRRLELADQQRGDLSQENQRLEELAGLTARGEKVESASALIRSSYVAERDRTVVLTVPERLTMADGPFEVPHLAWFSYEYPGQAMGQKPETVSLFVAAAGNARAKYKDLERVPLTLEGEVLELPVAEYSQDSRTAGASQRKQRRYTETLRFEVDGELLRRMAIARQASLRLSNVVVTVPEEVLATARAVRERIEIGQ